jgi:hypothetical protein
VSRSSDILARRETDQGRVIGGIFIEHAPATLREVDGGLLDVASLGVDAMTTPFFSRCVMYLPSAKSVSP